MKALVDYIKAVSTRINLSLWSVSSIQISDVLDILLVAYLIYIVITWIQRTRAWSVLKGIVIMIFMMVLAQMFRLNTIYWLIENTINVGIIALIVLFQPELRRALEQIGRAGKMSGFFASGDTHEMSRHTVSEIVAAAQAMAKVKTGALIVIEQGTQSNDYESTGIAIDAEVSSQLLINIFEKNTPLHDGAVVIRNNRVMAATCILPLTQEDIDKELGTRHRAAIGVSEVSDAAVLVVSEETGQISVSKEGELKRRLNEEQLFDILLGSERGRKRKGRRDDAKTV